MQSTAAPADDADDAAGDDGPDWQRRVVGRSLDGARRRSIDRGARFIRAAAQVLERNHGESLTVQDVADEAGQSLRTLYQYFASKDDLLLAVYEEAMRTYARMLRAAIKDLDDPIERLAGVVIASARIAALHDRAGVDRGLSRLRLQLSQAEPELVARSQEPVTTFYRELIEAAAAAGKPGVIDVEAGTYFLSSLRTAFIHSTTLGNEYDVALPSVLDLSCFSLSGLGLERKRSWHEDVDARLELSGGDGRSILRRLAKEPSRR
jgi:AcrR family transcriptional regulator